MDQCNVCVDPVSSTFYIATRVNLIINQFYISHIYICYLQDTCHAYCEVHAHLSLPDAPENMWLWLNK